VLHRLSYRTKLLLWILPMVVAGLLALSLSSYYHIHRIIERELTRSMLDATGKSAETINHWLETLLLEPETIAATPAALEINRDFTRMDQENINRYKLLHRKYAAMFLDIYAADGSGVYHTVARDAQGRFSLFRGDIADRPYFRSIMAGGPSQITQPLVSRTTGNPTLFVVAPIRDDAGHPQGLVGAGLSLDYVKRVAESLITGDHGYGFIIARDGTFIYHPDRSLVMRKRITEMEDPSVVALGRTMLAGGSGAVRYVFQGQEKLACYKPIPLAGWSVATTIPTKDLFAPATRMLQVLVLATLVISLAMALLIVLVSRRVTEPLRKLAAHAARLGGGDLDLGPVDIASGDELGALAATFNTMTRRLNATLRTLGENERQYRTLVDNLKIGIFRCRLEPFGAFHQINPAMLAMFGHDGPETFQGLALQDLFLHPEQREDCLDQLRTKGAVRNMELTLVRRDGTPVLCQMVASTFPDAQGRLEWLDGFLEDLTERRRLENHLTQSQKMEAIGTMAGGIAHDFNNLLTAILAYADLASGLVAEGMENPSLASFLERITDTAQDAAHLTQGLLAVSRRQVVSLAPIDVNASVRKVEALMARIIGEDIALRSTCCPGALTVLGDAGQLEQVLMNLVANARDAMPGGGTLSIATSLAEIPVGYAFLPLDPGKYALVSVSDTGSGMDEATRLRIFEPFFTTKAVGKGTGLGMAIAYGIIRQHNGEIHVYSEPGQGTTFRIYLKCIDFKLDLEPGPVAPGAVGTETILLAEDDPRVAGVYRTVLEGAGYRVLEAGDGEEAITLFKAHAPEIGLLLFDLVMPGLNGREAFAAIRPLAPDLRIIYCSGYPQEFLSGRELTEPGAHFIAKPTPPAELLRLVRSVLDRATPPPA